MRPLFEAKPATTEKVVAHALFLRCIDHFRAATVLANAGLDVEALVMVRGVSETMFVIGALLTGKLTTEKFQALDQAHKAKNARQLTDLLKRMAPPELQRRMQDFADRNRGDTDVKFQQLAAALDIQDLYDGYYRMFSHIAAHPSLTALDKYLDYGPSETTVRYPGSGMQAARVVQIAASALLTMFAGVEKWLTTTPAINHAIQAALLHLEGDRHALHLQGKG